MTPKISVIIPNYNHGHLLPHVIQGALMQEMGSVEVIVIDDGSTDQSLKILENIQSPFLKVIKLGQNRGALYAANRGLSEARGEYIHGVGADDFVFAYSYKGPLAILKKYPHVGMCVTPFSTWDGENKLIKYSYKRLDKPAYYTPDKVMELMLKEDFWASCTGTLFKKQSLMNMGGFSEALEMYADWYVMQSIALKEGVCFSPHSIATFRVSENSYSRKKDKTTAANALIKQVAQHPVFYKSGICSTLGWDFIRLLALKAPAALPAIFLKKINNRLRRPSKEEVYGKVEYDQFSAVLHQ